MGNQIGYEDEWITGVFEFLLLVNEEEVMRARHYPLLLEIIIRPFYVDHLAMSMSEN